MREEEEWALGVRPLATANRVAREVVEGAMRREGEGWTFDPGAAAEIIARGFPGMLQEYLRNLDESLEAGWVGKVARELKGQLEGIERRAGGG